MIRLHLATQRLPDLTPAAWVANINALAFDLEHRWASLRFAHAFGCAGGEYVSSKRVEVGDVLPQGMKLPNPFDLLSLANFLQEV
ncbi:MAG: hypothetical protein LAO23_21255 [Acidobacteriia bacterium]|nr:hypothetical protein [Terriglobia bacterium]